MDKATASLEERKPGIQKMNWNYRQVSGDVGTSSLQSLIKTSMRYLKTTTASVHEKELVNRINHTQDSSITRQKSTNRKCLILGEGNKLKDYTVPGRNIIG